MKKSLTLILLFLAIKLTAADHNPLMPQPQKLSYGKGSISLKEITIGFASSPADEDKYAAQTLAGIISQVTGSKPVIRGSAGKDAAVIFERTGKVDPLPVPGEKAGPGSRESYRIKITPGNIRITAVSSAGLFYAVQTIRQMIEGSGAGAVLPEAEIEDWPSMAYRGYMMDMSHAQFFKIEEIKNHIDFLARWKANWYLFYSEASIELEGYPLLMPDARYTKGQVKEIIEYAKARHIDVMPNMELYGHLHDLFRLEHYADMAVVPHGGEFNPTDPRIKPLINDWVKQVSDIFPSPFFHIGFDETWMLEWEAKKLGTTPEELYLGMLKHTTDAVEREGKRALVWVDMLQKFPATIPQVSSKIVAVSWHYNPLPEERYDQLFSPFRKAGIDLIVQGASINWNWVTPAFEISFKNADVILQAGRKYNAIGFINSGWTDDSQTITRMSFPDLAYGSIASWQSAATDRESFFNKYARILYPPELAALAEKAHTSMSVSESLIRKSLGATDPAFWANAFSDASKKKIESNRENLRNGRLAAEDALVAIRAAMKYGIDTTTFVSMLAGSTMLDYISMKYIYAGEIMDFWKQLTEKPSALEYRLLINWETSFKYHSRTSDMLDAIMATKDIFRRAWLNEYSPFRLNVALGKYDVEYEYWLEFQRRLQEYSYNENVPLPPLSRFFTAE